MISLPYIGINSEESRTTWGYAVCTNLEAYNGARVRNNVVLRLDIVDALDKVFDGKSRMEFRNTLFNFISGNIIDTEQITNVLEYLYTEDKTFQIFLGTLYYFDESTKNKPLYKVIIDRIREAYVARFGEAYKVLREKHYKIICESNGYLYFSVPDESGFEATLPKGFKEEVLSCAKNWEGVCKRI